MKLGVRKLGIRKVGIRKLGTLRVLDLGVRPVLESVVKICPGLGALVI